jgi:putative PIN family toxin of toxin-antitoxin system
MIVIDTDVIVAAIRSRTGGSAELVRRVLRREVKIALSVAMVLEYEAVGTRAEHLAAGQHSAGDVLTLIDALVSLSGPVEGHFRWRPQLRDPNDEMILEAAVNARAEAIVTFNKRDFEPASAKFGVDLLSPREALRRFS